MRRIKTLQCFRIQIIGILFLMPTLFSHAQIIDVKKTAENAVINRTNQVINDGINMGVNAIFNAPGKIYRKIKDNKNNKNQNGNSPSASNYPTGSYPTNNYNTSSPTSNLNTINDSNYTPGTSSFWSDNFQSAGIGTFPGNWTTSSVGEVRTVEEKNWLQISADGMFAPSELKSLPENFSLEFDGIFNSAPSKEAHYILYLYSTLNPASDFAEPSYPGKGGIYFAFNTNTGEIDSESFENAKGGMLDFHIATDALKSSIANKIHIAIQKKDTQVRLFINGGEVFSSMRALSPGVTYDAIKFGSFYMSNDDFMLISNLNISTY
jgi:OmpA-OmpF porin, OOP family